MKSAGRGKATTDSGAEESVMSRGMLEGEPLVEGEAKRLGVKYVAANGAKVDNYGQKRIRFKKEGLSGVSDMLFQVDVTRSHVAQLYRCLIFRRSERHNRATDRTQKATQSENITKTSGRGRVSGR